ncbi:MAG: EamA family transporter [Clostridiales bacterium]|nr:EamA family transporter [Clostridiales bacterium]
MWLIFALLSALFAGISSILAKVGIGSYDSNLCTALRTSVVLVFSWIMVFITGAFSGISDISAKTLLFLLLSGICTGGSWICYFKALSIGDINRVVPIDKSSTILTIVLGFILFGEPVGALKLTALVLLGAGIFLMIEKKPSDNTKSGRRWLLYAAASAVFASLTTIFGKLGVTGINPDLGSAIRTTTALVLAWALAASTGKISEIRSIDRRSYIFIILSGIATGASWLCYYRALADGVTSAVVAIDKLSLLVTIGFAFIVFHEKLSKRAAVGLVLMILGTFIMTRI